MKLLLFFMPIFLLAIPSLKEVLNYPHTYYRDFYLTEYLKKTKEPKKAEFLYNQITYKKNYHFRLLANRNKKYMQIYECKHPNRHNWNRIDIECMIQNGFNFASLKKMSNNEFKKLLNTIPESTVKEELKILYNKKYIKMFGNRTYFYDIFFSVKPNIYIPSLYINNIAKDIRFYRFLNYVIRSHNFSRIKRALLNLHYKELKDKYKFLLALNAITLHRYNLAIHILKSKKHKKNIDNFWLYLLTKNKKYANRLLKNKRLDFYTMYIYEKFNKPYKIDKVPISNKAKKIVYDIDNPLDVIEFYKDKVKVKDFFKFAEKLDNQKMLPLKALALDKAFKYRKNYYIMPKYDLKDLNLSQKALFYALARQESRFIAAQTSRSYAIGLMQMMPFLIRSFKPKEDISEFFRADVNVKYAKKHMKWLIRKLKHPLFVSYAYNGGIGFTKRKVKKYFKFKGLYEPFLSMEMVPYSESREYGKKVLTNYVIYKDLLGDRTSLHKLLNIKN